MGFWVSFRGSQIRWKRACLAVLSKEVFNSVTRFSKKKKMRFLANNSSCLQILVSGKVFCWILVVNFYEVAC